MRKRGFTLVEMMVVLAMIALLLAILQPTLWRARDVSYRAVCTSNLHQIQAANLSWATDHSTALVIARPVWPDQAGHFALWQRVTIPLPKPEYGQYTAHGVLATHQYIQAKVFYCPSKTTTRFGYNTGPYGWYDNLADVPSATDFMHCSYVANGTLGPANAASFGDFHAPTLRDAATTPLFSDLFGAGNPYNADGHHRDGYTVARLDGSVFFFDDRTRTLINLNGGSAYFSGSSNYVLFIAKAWRILNGSGEH